MTIMLGLAALVLVVRRRRKARQRRAVAGLATALLPAMPSPVEIPRGYFKGHGGAM